MPSDPQPRRSFRAAGRILAVVVAIACVAGTAIAATRLAPTRAAPSDPEVTAPPDAIRAVGRVRGMYPGRVRMLRVRVSNAGPDAVTLRTVRARVRRAAPGCPAPTLVVRRFHGSVRLAAGSTVVIRMRARMRRSAGDACQGVRYPIAFRVRTVPA